MGEITKHIKKQSFQCQMCTKFGVDKDQYLWEGLNDNILLICKPCAKREHGHTNKITLEEHIIKHAE